jgi:hypothetical protein
MTRIGADQIRNKSADIRVSRVPSLLISLKEGTEKSTVEHQRKALWLVERVQV